MQRNVVKGLVETAGTITGSKSALLRFLAIVGFALTLGSQGVAVHHSVVTPELVRAAHLRELRLSTWTVNKRDDVRRVAAAGVDALTTDYPDRARRWLPKGRV